MSMGGSSSAPTNQTITQTNIPKEFMPYFERLMGRVEEQSLQPYQAYGGPRIASSDQFGDIGAAWNMTRNIAGKPIEGLSSAQNTMQQNIAKAGELGQYAPGQFSQYEFGPITEFSSEEVQKRMSPYIENVLDVQKARAEKDFLRQAGIRNTKAAAAGAFGGSRQAVQEGLAGADQMQLLSELEATGRQAAFEQAAQQFGMDRAAKMELDRLRAAELGRVQTGTEASRQFGAGQGLAALNAANLGAMNLAQLGQMGRSASIQDAQMLEAIGRAQQGEAQAGLDIGYQDYLRQQGYPQEQLAFYSDILRGLPVAPASSQTQQSYQYYNPLQQMLGAGLSGLSLYKAYGQ